MKRITVITARIAITLLLLFAGGSFPVTAGSFSDKPGGLPQTESAVANLTDPGTTQIFLPILTKNYIAPAPLWRFGAALTRSDLSAYDSAGLVTMRFGWYVDYVATADPSNPYDMEYVPTVRVKQLKIKPDLSKTSCCVTCGYVPHDNTAEAGVNYVGNPTVTQTAAIAASHPGMTWLIGNEMDRLDTGTDAACGNQDEMVPELYAHVYHDYYYAIKAADPTAKVAIGGLVEFTQLRRMYLDRILAEYSSFYAETMPVDVWNTHLYILQEKSCISFPLDCWGAAIPAGISEADGRLYGEQHSFEDNKDFTQAWAQIIALRTWMKTNGYQARPLIITEYGVLFPAWLDCPAYPNTSGCPFTHEQVRDSFMYPSFDAFLNNTDPDVGFPADGNRLVQRWNWFSIDYDYISCEDGISYEKFAGFLFNTGLGPSSPSPDCVISPLGLTSLGTYWQQYVKNLPAGATPPYAP